MDSLILASASPRRHDLLSSLGLSFIIEANDGEERQDQVPSAIVELLPAFDLGLTNHPTLLAWRKAQAAREVGHSAAILAADTIVVIDSLILGKPRDPAHAYELLRRLAGRWHTVYTGVVVLPATSDQPLCELAVAQVRLSPLSDAEIWDYIATGEPMDKAGAYGVQGIGGRLVEEVQGSFTTVVGLPLPTTASLLAQAGMHVPYSVEQAWQRWRATLAKEPLCMQQSKC